MHLLRNSFRYASKKDWGQIAKDLKPVYTAASEAAALDAFAEFSGTWEKQYPAIIRLWENAWPEFVPFLAFDREIRAIICTTRSSPSTRGSAARSRPAATSPPSKPPSSTSTSPSSASTPPAEGRKRWSNRWKAALNAFDITFEGLST